MDNLYKSLATLQKKIPWCSDILQYVKIEKTNSVNIAAVKKDKKVKRYILMLSDKILSDDTNLIGVIEHELLHILYSHIDLTWPKENFQLANIAMDCVINETGIFCKKITLDKVDSKSLFDIYGVRTNAQYDTSKDIFDRLQENKNEADNTTPENFDDTDLKDLLDSENIIQDSDLEKIADKLDRNYGKLSSELNRSVKSRKANFKQLFQKFIFNTLKRDSKNTWKRKSRRFTNFKGTVKNKRPNILLLVDTSCSMTNETLEKINYQVNLLSKHYDLHVIWGDTKLQGEKVIRKNTKFTNEFTSGGGTDLSFYQDIKGNFDLYIFNTDGYIPRMEIPSKSVFCIYDQGREVDGFKNIHIA